MKIAIVCNGWKCRLNQNGSFIDSCDLVLRMNRFNISGYESYVGSKTDVISLMITGEGSTSGILGHGPLLQHADKSIWIPDKYRFEHQYQRDRASDHFKKSHDEFLFVDSVIYDRLLNKMVELSDTTSDCYYPDSGMTNIETCLYRYPGAEIWVFGFDPHRNHPYKYYWTETDENAENSHPQVAEAKLFDEYKKQGLIHETN